MEHGTLAYTNTLGTCDVYRVMINTDMIPEVSMELWSSAKNMTYVKFIHGNTMKKRSSHTRQDKQIETDYKQ